MRIKGIRSLLLGAGFFFLIGNGVRFYRLIRTHVEDTLFAPHLLLATLSLALAWKVTKIALDPRDLTRGDAISLIRSGSVLMGIWSYRFYLLLPVALESGPTLALGLAIVYVLLGGIVMGVGLFVSRSLRCRTS